MRINRQNPGRTFEVLQHGVGYGPIGTRFTDYDVRRMHRAPPPNPGDDPVASTEDFYEDLLDGLINHPSPAIRIVAPAQSQPMPISKHNQGRSFEVLHQAVGNFVRGNIFTEYEYRRLYPAPAPDPGDDPVTSANDYYENSFGRLLRMTPPAIRVIAPAVEPAVANQIDPVRLTKQQGAELYRTPIARDFTRQLAEGLKAKADELTAAKAPEIKKSNWHRLLWFWRGLNRFWGYIVEHKVWSRVVGSLITAVILLWLAHHYAWFNSHH